MDPQPANPHPPRHAQVLRSLDSAEKKGPPDLSTMFEDVYETKPRHLEIQEEDLLEHIAKYPERYGAGH